MTTSSCDFEKCEAIKENLKYIREKIANAAASSGRSENDVRLMAVTKTVDPVYINYSIDECGVDLIGENKVQEFLSKKDSLHLNGVTKHLIGHLQTNKVNKIVTEVDMIQSVDSLHLAKEISKRAGEAGITANVLLKINIGGEESKTGYDKKTLLSELSELSELLDLGGLLKRKTGKLSGGQLRRIDIARALLSEPEILILKSVIKNPYREK